MVSKFRSRALREEEWKHNSIILQTTLNTELQHFIRFTQEWSISNLPCSPTWKHYTTQLRSERVKSWLPCLRQYHCVFSLKGLEYARFELGSEGRYTTGSRTHKWKVVKIAATLTAYSPNPFHCSPSSQWRVSSSPPSPGTQTVPCKAPFLSQPILEPKRSAACCVVSWQSAFLSTRSTLATRRENGGVSWTEPPRKRHSWCLGQCSVITKPRGCSTELRFLCCW